MHLISNPRNGIFFRWVCLPFVFYVWSCSLLSWFGPGAEGPCVSGAVADTSDWGARLQSQQLRSSESIRGQTQIKTQNEQHSVLSFTVGGTPEPRTQRSGCATGLGGEVVMTASWDWTASHAWGLRCRTVCTAVLGSRVVAAGCAWDVAEQERKAQAEPQSWLALIPHDNSERWCGFRWERASVFREMRFTLAAGRGMNLRIERQF